MNWTVELVQSPEKASAREAPAHYASVKPGQRWRVVTGAPPVNTPADDRPPLHTWLTPASGEVLRIPLVPYQVERDGALAMAFAVQLGLCVGSLLPGARSVQLVLGHRIDDLVPEGVNRARFWIGIAVEG